MYFYFIINKLIYQVVYVVVVMIVIIIILSCPVIGEVAESVLCESVSELLYV